MKQRILTGWNFTRGLYLAMGLVMIIQSVLVFSWFGLIFGGYFASMGLFAFGCASGACFSGVSARNSGKKTDGNSQDIEFEEVK